MEKKEYAIRAHHHEGREGILASIMAEDELEALEIFMDKFPDGIICEIHETGRKTNDSIV
jgi:hypothetical protein